MLSHAPLVVLQRSAVQSMPSAQFLAAPATQAPDRQVSVSVHALLSLHVAPSPAAGCWHVPLAQVSAVQPLPSSQFFGVVPTQVPVWHLSTVVQASPSSQAAPVVGAC